MERHLIVGPPGTGKTHTLMEILAKEVEVVDPARIALVTFTKAGAEEMKARAKQKFDVSFPYIRTLHSFAFYALSLSMRDMMGDEDYEKIAHSMGMLYKRHADPTDLPTSQEYLNAYISDHQYARTTFSDLVPRNPDLNKHFWDRFIRADREYKHVQSKLDFTDLLERVTEPFEMFDVVIVDEAQDLTPLQWRMVSLLCHGAQRLYVAGDDDQAIYEWAGADITTFRSFSNERNNVRTLSRSFRLPRSVHTLAEAVRGNIRGSLHKEWGPRDDDGMLRSSSERDWLMRCPPAKVEGTWLLLARNHVFLQGYRRALREHGVIFPGCGLEKYIKPVVYWERLRKGHAIPVGEANEIARILKLKGFNVPGRTATYADFKVFDVHDAPWFRVFSTMGTHQQNYMRRALARGEDLLAPPKVRVSTIHTVKGEEADHVVVNASITRRCHEKLSVDADEEHRCFYTAVTRARHTLMLLHGGSEYEYPFPRH